MVDDLLGPAEDVRRDGADDRGGPVAALQQPQRLDDPGVNGGSVVADSPAVPAGVAVEGDADLHAGQVLVEEVEPGGVEEQAVGLEADPNHVRVRRKGSQYVSYGFFAGGERLAAVQFDREWTVCEERRQLVHLSCVDAASTGGFLSLFEAVQAVDVAGLAAHLEDHGNGRAAVGGVETRVQGVGLVRGRDSGQCSPPGRVPRRQAVVDSRLFAHASRAASVSGTRSSARRRNQPSV